MPDHVPPPRRSTLFDDVPVERDGVLDEWAVVTGLMREAGMTKPEAEAYLDEHGFQAAATRMLYDS